MKLVLTALLVLTLASCASTPIQGEVVGKKYYPSSRSITYIKPIIFRNKPERWTLNVKAESGSTAEVTVSKNTFDQADVGEHYDDSTKQLTP